MQRYLSQIALCEISDAGQQRLQAASILVVGAGGLGCAALPYLAAAGVGRLGIVDPDRIELSNLSRQPLYRDADIGRPKAEVSHRRVSELNPQVAVHSFQLLLTPENATQLFQGYDLVIDATDNFAARLAINDACLRLGKPWVYGAIHRFEGQVALFDGGDYRALYPTPPDSSALPTCAQGGVIGALAGIIGSIQALEAIKWIVQTHTLANRLLRINALTWSTQLFELSPERPLEISLKAVHQLLSQGVDVHLIDHQEATAPVGQVTVITCPGGIRSAQVARALRHQFPDREIYSLKDLNRFL